MFQYVSGNLIQAQAQALVNTVNCKGVMGKGLAYQFQQHFPQNFKSYQAACQRGDLRPGRLHCFEENGKLIINFPTKDDWRRPSLMEYVEDGLSELADLLQERDVQSVAIPPLGCGLGGLEWDQVRPLIEAKLAGLAESVEIYIYGASSGPAVPAPKEPPLNVSGLVLLELMAALETAVLEGPLTPLRVRLAAFFTNLYAGEKKDVFKFSRPKNQDGPHSLEVDRLLDKIRAFMNYHAAETPAQARDVLHRKLMSKSVNAKLEQLRPAMEQACGFVEQIFSDRELAELASVCFAVRHEDGPLTPEAVYQIQQNWPKAARGADVDRLTEALDRLCQDGIMTCSLFGYELAL